MKLRNSTFFKYVISYVLVLSVAFVGFYAVVQFQLEREYRSVYQDETERKIQNISIVLDQELRSVSGCFRTEKAIHDQRARQGHPVFRYSK